MKIDRQDPQALLSFVEKTLKAAADGLLKEKTSGDVLSSIGRDIKLKGDLISEKKIMSELQEHTPYPILSEEAGWDTDESINTRKDYHWVLDPLDGTFNFARSIPFCCMSLGLWKNGQPILGAVYDFNRGICYKGIVGVGAWANDEAMEVSQTQELSQSVLSTGFPSKMNMKPENLNRYLNQIKHYKKVRMMGAAALSLAMTASGQLDVHFEEDTMYWDVAAGIALVLAAGGEVSYKFVDQDNGQSSSNKMNVIACNKKLMQQISI